MSKTKTRFISDVHLNDATSLAPPPGQHPWSWCSAARAQLLADFLNETAAADDVGELVILGDLFDGWMLPAGADPGKALDRFACIAEAPQNCPAISALRHLARDTDVRVSYVPGNHDMLVSEEILAALLPGVRYLGTPHGLGAYHAAGLSAEHGHAYALFTSPDPWTVPGSVLPLGYYDTRALAEALARNASPVSVCKVIEQFVEQCFDRKGIAGAVFRALCARAGLDADSRIVMNHLDNMPDALTVGTIEDRYGKLYREWPSRWSQEDNVPAYLALLGDAGHLFPAAVDRYISQGSADIVIFGHTHRHEIRDAWADLASHEEEDRGADTAARHIYANSGAWIDGVPATFVETELDADAGRFHVRLKEYEGPGRATPIGRFFVARTEAQIWQA